MRIKIDADDEWIDFGDDISVAMEDLCEELQNMHVHLNKHIHGTLKRSMKDLKRSMKHLKKSFKHGAHWNHAWNFDGFQSDEDWEEAPSQPITVEFQESVEDLDKSIDSLNSDLGRDVASSLKEEIDDVEDLMGPESDVGDSSDNSN